MPDLPLPAASIATTRARIVFTIAIPRFVAPANLRYALRAIPVDPTFSANAPFQQVKILDDDAATFDSIVANRGVANAKYCIPGPKPSAVREPTDRNYRDEEFLVPAENSVIRRQWSPNRLAFDVDVPAPATLTINRNFDRYWRLRGGDGYVVDSGGLLAVRVPAGRQEITLRYQDLSWLGAIVTLLTVVGAKLLRRHKSSVTGAAAPPKGSKE